MNLKTASALKAVELIRNNSIIGLGAGSTMAFMVEYLADEVKNGLQIQVASSSFSTRELLLQKGFKVLSIQDIAEIDIYFDGCDLVDKNLNALKSGGGIHTIEKLLASMAKEFILVVDTTKYVGEFNTDFPLVVEFLPQALSFVPATVKRLFEGALTSIRFSNKKDGPVITENGNYLLDIKFNTWPPLDILAASIKEIAGIVDSSLFYGLVNKVIVASTDGVTIIDNPVTKK